MSLNLALKNAFVSDLEKSIETHKSMPLGSFKSDYEAQKAFGIINGFEAAKKHYETLYSNLESLEAGSTPPQEVNVSNVSDAEIIEPQ